MEAEIGTTTVKEGEATVTITNYLRDRKYRNLNDEQILAVATTICAAYRDEVIVRANTRDGEPKTSTAAAIAKVTQEIREATADLVKIRNRKRSSFREWFWVMAGTVAAIYFFSWLFG